MQSMLAREQLPGRRLTRNLAFAWLKITVVNFAADPERLAVPPVPLEPDIGIVHEEHRQPGAEFSGLLYPSIRADTNL